jgi:hypothetical protein
MRRLFGPARQLQCPDCEFLLCFLEAFIMMRSTLFLSPEDFAADADESLFPGKPAGADPTKIKTLPPSVVKDIEQKNIARRLAALSPIVIKIRRCIACSAQFESAGNRTCGCSSRTAGTISGREII